MSTLAAQLRLGRAIRIGDVVGVLVVAATLAWSVIAVGTASGTLTGPIDYSDWLPLLGPIPLGIALLLWRPHSPLWLKYAFGYALSITLALETVIHVGDNRLLGAGPLVMLITTALALRFRTATLAVVMLLTGTTNALEAFTPIEAGLTADLAIASGWMALIWLWITGRAQMPRLLPVAALPLVAYVLLSVVYAFVMDPLEQGLFGWRASCWYMSLVLLVALYCDGPEQRARLQRAILAAVAVWGAYAMVRWVIGPAEREAAPVRLSGPYVTTDLGELRLFGAALSPQQLGVLSAICGPFALASALSPIPLFWRMVGVVAAVCSGLALYGADSRTAMVAAAAGFLTVIVVYGVGRGFEGRRALPVVLALLIGLGGGGAFTAIKLGGTGGSAVRFENIFDPLADLSVQGRLVKWETILDDVDDKPLGNGLGASGAAEQRYARFSSSASYDPDSALVKVAYDQGFAVMLLFVFALLALIAGLAVRAVRARDPVNGAIAAGACAAVVANTVVFTALTASEGLGAAAPWILAGLGLAATGDDGGDDPV